MVETAEEDRHEYPLDPRARADVWVRAGVSDRTLCRYFQGHRLFPALRVAIEEALRIEGHEDLIRTEEDTDGREDE